MSGGRGEDGASKIRLACPITAEDVDLAARSDVLARTGGDEFIVLMPNTEPPEATAVLDRLRAAHPVEWSAGVASRQTGESLEQCIERAGHELYAAKHAR